MSRFDQAKMLMRVKKIQKELQKQVITVEQGDGAVRIEITGEQKIKKVHIDASSVDLDDIGQLERWIDDAVKDAIQQSQKVAAEKDRRRRQGCHPAESESRRREDAADDGRTGQPRTLRVLENTWPSCYHQH
jgi:nucleoid-associated protein EbfC